MLRCRNGPLVARKKPRLWIHLKLKSVKQTLQNRGVICCESQEVPWNLQTARCLFFVLYIKHHKAFQYLYSRSCSWWWCFFFVPDDHLKDSSQKSAKIVSSRMLAKLDFSGQTPFVFLRYWFHGIRHWDAVFLMTVVGVFSLGSKVKPALYKHTLTYRCLAATPAEAAKKSCQICQTSFDHFFFQHGYVSGTQF